MDSEAHNYRWQIESSHGTTNNQPGSWILINADSDESWNRILGMRRFQAAAPNIGSALSTSKGEVDFSPVAPENKKTALCVASRITRTYKISWIIPDVITKLVSESSQASVAINVYAASTSPSTRVTLKVENGNFSTTKECLSPERQITPNFNSGIFDVFAVPLPVGSSEKLNGTVFSIEISATPAETLSASIVSCFTNARVLWAPPNTKTSSASGFTLSVSPNRVVTVKPPRAPFYTEHITVEASDGIVNMSEDAWWIEDGFVAKIPSNIGWTSRRPGGQPNRLTNVRAFVNGEPCDDGRLTTIAAERSAVIARFEPSEINTKEHARESIRNMVRGKAVWMFGTVIGRRWASVSKTSQIAASVPAFDIANDRNLVEPFVPCAAVFSDCGSDTGFASLEWSETIGKELRLPKKSEIDPDCKIYIALNAYGKSVSAWSSAILKLINSHDESEAYSFTIIAPNQDLTSRNPTSLAFDITKLCGTDVRKSFDVSILVNKQRASRDATILICISSLRVVETSPISSVLSKPFLGTIPSTGELFYCVDARKSDDTPSNSVGSDALIAKVITPPNRVVAEVPLRYDAINTTQTRTVFSVPAKNIREALSKCELSAEAASTNGVFLVEAVNTALSEKVATEHPVVFDSVNQKVLYADVAVANAMQQNDETLAARYAAYSSKYDVKWGRVIPREAAELANRNLRAFLFALTCSLIVFSVLLGLYIFWRFTPSLTSILSVISFVRRIALRI